jgi:hypothetical protein
MNVLKATFFIWLLLFSQHGIGQTTTVVEGRVTDKNTHQPMDYANIRFKGSLSAMRTDTGGYFKVSTTQKVKAIVVSYLGYQSAEFPVQMGVSNHIDVQLKPQNIELSELIVRPHRKKKREIDTTALYIYHHVVDNKDFNKATSFDSYHYDEYSKMVYSVENPTPRLLNAKAFKPYKFFFEKEDSTNKGQPYIPLFIQEDYLETYYRKNPKQKINVLHYNHMSGIKQPAFVKLIGYHFEVTDAYENVHIVLQKSFVSPFSPEGSGLYSYHVLDTSKIEGRTSYRLNFVGRNKEDLCVKGFADIDSATWAIKFISYRPNEKANLNYIYDLLEEQSFKLVNGHWLMTKENLTLEANILKDPKRMAIRIVKTTLRNNITTNVTFPDSIAKVKDDIVDRGAYRRKITYIDSLRMDTLTSAEKLVYHHFDTLKTVPSYQGIKVLTTLVSQANVKAGPFDFGRLYRVASVNNVEGYRFRLGLYSNPDLDDKMFLGAYGAYGTKDKRWKYSANFRYLLPAKYDRWHAIELEYKNDMVLLGQENPALTYDNITTLITGNILSKIMRIRETNLYYERDWIKGLSSIITLSDWTYYSIPGVFNFSAPDGHGNFVYLPGFNTNEISATLRYCKTDYYFQSYTYRYPLQTKTPSITFKYAMGLKDQLFNGDYTYFKLSLQLNYRWQLPVGYSKIMVRTGYTFGDSPYPVSYIASSNTSILRDDYAFQSTAPFEFVTDKFIMAWWEHYFDGFFFNRIPYVNRLHLREYVQIKALYGGYSQHNADLMPLPAGMTSPSQVPYIEVGCGVENILNVLHIDFLWRVTYRDNPSAPNFTVKLALYPGF